jgi:hypothetical protein
MSKFADDCLENESDITFEFRNRMFTKGWQRQEYTGVRTITSIKAAMTRLENKVGPGTEIIVEIGEIGKYHYSEL